MATRTKPLPKKERILTGRELNRGLQRGRGSETNQRKDTTQNVSVGLMDVDAAIMYYFNEVIKPKVVINKQEVKVPVYYANAERWNSIQKQGYVRDSKGSLITPLIVFKRVSIEDNETLPIDKLDANDPKQFYTFEKKYSQSQRYDRFSVLKGILPQKEYFTTAVPDYMKLNYECVVWTPYIEDMNRIVEQINFSEGAYWGEPNRFKFHSSIDSFEDATEMGDNERIIKTTFNMSFNGYLIPESFNEFINTQRFFTPKQVVVEDESGLVVSSLFSPDSRSEKVSIFSVGKSSLASGLGSAADFIRGLSTGVGNQAQDLEFTNTFGGRTFYVMRGVGEPTSSRDDKALLSVSNANSTYNLKSFRVSGSQSSSLSASQGQVYQPTLETERRIMSSSVQVKLNGLELTSANDQVGFTSGFDYFVSSSFKDVVIRKRQSDNSGFTLTNTDYVTIIFQSEMT
jgi:hypothetical protein